jgi:hypothetical protein
MSNSRRLSYVISKTMCLLKLLCDQNLIVIDHNPNSNFKSHFIFKGIQEELLALLLVSYTINTATLWTIWI